MSYLIGIDVGTSNVKAVLFDLQGKEEKNVYRRNEPLYLGQSRVEQDMNVLWEKALECLIELVKDYDRDLIKGIALTGQGEGCWLIDKDRQPVSNSYLWCDGRAKHLVNVIFADKEKYDLIFNTTGTQPLTGTALTLLMWSKENRKGELDKADKLMFAKDWIRYKLTGEVGLDTTDAGTSLLNIESLTLAEDMLEQLGLSEYKHLFSDVHNPYDIAGTITEEIAELTGLRKDTPVSYGALDVSASTLGVGAIHPGDICTIMGTTVATNIVTDTIDPGKKNTRFEKHGIDGLYINLQPTMSGTTNIDWAYKNISLTKSFGEIDQELGEMPPVSTGVVYHPYLNTAGERSPFFNSNARSSFFGVNAETTRMDLLKSVYEGIAFSIQDCIVSSGAKGDGKIYLAGGGAESNVWAQIIADVTNKEIHISDEKELAAKGAVIMLSVTLGMYDTYDQAIKAMCRSEKVFNPSLENVKIYEEFFKFYIELREDYVPLWNKRNEIMKKVRREE